LRYHDPRRFGALLGVEGPVDNNYISHLGLELLTDEFDAAYLYEKSRGKKAPLKLLLWMVKSLLALAISTPMRAYSWQA
jgi:formamidopyrimidine-DNA glycosylase